MKHSEAKALILLQWDRWIQTRTVDPGGPTGRDSLQFFFELQDTKSPLLDFQSRGHDRWRIIHAWLLSEGRVSDPWISPAPPIVPGRKPSPAREKARIGPGPARTRKRRPRRSTV